MGQLGQVSDERRTGGYLFSELESEKLRTGPGISPALVHGSDSGRVRLPASPSRLPSLLPLSRGWPAGAASRSFYHSGTVREAVFFPRRRGRVSQGSSPTISFLPPVPHLLLSDLQRIGTNTVLRGQGPGFGRPLSASMAC